MILDLEAVLLGNAVLQRLDFRVEKLGYLAAAVAHHMVVVAALVQLVYRFARLEMVTNQNARLLELRQHAVNGGQADVGILGDQLLVDVFSRHMPIVAGLEQVENTQARTGGFQADPLQMAGFVHVVYVYRGWRSYSMIKPFHRFPNCDPGAMAMMLKSFPLIAVLFLSACSSFNPTTWLTAHRMDVQQGNYVTEDAVSRVKTGMTRPQVKFLLGTPLLADIFHGNRWDYAYRIERQGKPTEEKRLTVYFDKDVVSRIEGQAFPALRPTLDNTNPNAGQR